MNSKTLLAINLTLFSLTIFGLGSLEYMNIKAYKGTITEIVE